MTYECSAKGGFKPHKADGKNHVFTPSKKGPFFSDVKSDIVQINTVDSIKNIYTVKSIPMPGKPGPYRTS